MYARKHSDTPAGWLCLDFMYHKLKEKSMSASPPAKHQTTVLLNLLFENCDNYISDHVLLIDFIPLFSASSARRVMSAKTTQLGNCYQQRSAIWEMPDGAHALVSW